MKCVVCKNRFPDGLDQCPVCGASFRETYYEPVMPKGDGFSVWGFVFSLCGILSCVYLIGSIIGLVLSAIGFRRGVKAKLAFTGLILSVFGFVLGLFLVISGLYDHLFI